MDSTTAVAWSLMAIQMIAWAWMQRNGGSLPDRKYFIFCPLFMLGQIGASIECIASGAWGTLVVQAYFFASTAYGALMRYRQRSTFVRGAGPARWVRKRVRFHSGVDDVLVHECTTLPRWAPETTPRGGINIFEVFWDAQRHLASATDGLHCTAIDFCPFCGRSLDTPPGVERAPRAVASA